MSNIVACTFACALLTSVVCGQGLGGLDADVLDNIGNEFVVSFMPNDIDGPPEAVELHLTSSTAASVTVEYPSTAPTFEMTVDLVPGTITIVELPTEASIGWTADTVANNAVRASSSSDFVCYMVNRQAFTSDAALALPVDALNEDYIVIDYTAVGLPSQFVVTAAFDSTIVTITPTVDLIGGHAAGVPFDVTLDAGEGYYAEPASFSGPASTATGTRISASRPVGLTNGGKCAQVPVGFNFCDHIFEVAQPLQTWGTCVVVANLPNRPSGSIYRIVAGADDTTVLQDGAPLATLDEGDFVEIGPTPANIVFESADPEKAIFVCQYMTGSSNPGANEGDPAQGNMTPVDQFLAEYTFSTVGGSQFDQDFLTIIAENDAVGTLTLDGVVVPASSFAVVGDSGFSVAVLDLAEGSHTTSSPGFVHGITVQGYNQDDSYLYPGGARFVPIFPVGDSNPPLCEITLEIGESTASGVASDALPSEDVNGNGALDPGEDLNGNGEIDEDSGIFDVSFAPGSDNVVLAVEAFVPGDPVVDFTVSLVDGTAPGAGTVVVRDGSGNETLCPVAFTVPIVIEPNSCSNGEGADVTLVAAGELAPPWAITLDLLGAEPHSVAVLLAGTEAANLSRQGCPLIFSPAVSFPFVTDARGGLSIEGRLPDDLPSGSQVFLQFYVLQVPSFATSDTVVLTIP